MDILFSLVSLVTTLLGSLLLLRAYLWSLAISPRDPMASFVWKATDWLVNPIGAVVRPRGNWEWPSLVGALVVSLVHVLLMRELTGFPVTVQGFVIAPFALILRWAIDMIVWGVIIECILSFIHRTSYSPYRALLGTLTNPFLRPIRRVLPTFKGFDFSPIVLFLGLSLLERFVMPLSLGMVL